MDAKLKKLWVAELRSGAWMQAEGTLFDAECGGFCCLGVLRELMPNDSAAYKRKETSAFCRAVKFAGSIEDKLVDMNDCERKSFPEIADWIEANL